ncbi:MAG: hypothetical protein H6736_15755 [Alphaproteobacteria bacterium]|nr:hypothetical protein [Alphaproteobacteria bacterium]MCB9693266.1 hypothetical protein [Alphaproteobacteria bacterium]
MRALLPFVLLLAACNGGEVEPQVCDASAPRQTYVISALSFARRDAGVVDGFDLDGLDTAQGDPDGCGHADLVSPDGVPGIDNNFSALVPILESTEAVAAESLIAQSIASGELLITLTLGDVDNWVADDCVDLTVGRAEGVPLVGPDGVLLDHQTLAPHSTIASVSTMGAADDLQITGGDLAFNLPLDVLNAELDFEVSRGVFQLQKRYDGAITGVMGGMIPIRQIVEILERDDVNLQSFIPIVQATADVRGDSGTCDSLSLAFELEALPAWLAED